jgi:FKBP-type peptidyl-prolyl cis-trans isomerase
MSFNVQTVQPGNGSKPTKGSKVTVHYTGKLTNGTEFDSSVRRKKPFEFTLGVGQVIKGWDEGVAKMSVGEKAVITCPPDYAYGKQNVGDGLIPPNSTLVFDVELISFK